MDELIAKLETATGPDRELDIAIAYACLPLHHSGRWSVVTAPAFTESLNAALSLVPEEWTAWELRSSGRKTRFSADLSRLTECDAGEDWAHGRGPTPALAICVAAIKACLQAPTQDVVRMESKG